MRLGVVIALLLALSATATAADWSQTETYPIAIEAPNDIGWSPNSTVFAQTNATHTAFYSNDMQTQQRMIPHGGHELFWATDSRDIVLTSSDRTLVYDYDRNTVEFTHSSGGTHYASAMVYSNISTTDTHQHLYVGNNYRALYANDGTDDTPDWTRVAEQAAVFSSPTEITHRISSSPICNGDALVAGLNKNDPDSYGTYDSFNYRCGTTTGRWSGDTERAHNDLTTSTEGDTLITSANQIVGYDGVFDGGGNVFDQSPWSKYAEEVEIDGTYWAAMDDDGRLGLGTYDPQTPNFVLDTTYNSYPAVNTNEVTTVAFQQPGIAHIYYNSTSIAEYAVSGIPRVAGYAPNDDATGVGQNSGDTISVETSATIADADDSSVDLQFYWGNGTLLHDFGSVSSGSEHSTTIDGLGYGTSHEWYIVASDDAGNVVNTKDRRGTYSFTTLDPRPDISGLTSGDNVNDTYDGSYVDVNLTATVTDPDSDTVDVTFYWQNGTTITSFTGAETGTFAYQLDNLAPDTEYGWFVTATDPDGNERSTDVTTFTTIDTAPTIADVDPQNYMSGINDTTDGSYVDVDLSATVRGLADPIDVTFKLQNGTVLKSFDPVDSHTTLTYTMNNIAFDRTVDWRITATDAEGRTATSDQSFTTLEQSPNVVDASPNDERYDTRPDAGEITFDARIEDFNDDAVDYDVYVEGLKIASASDCAVPCDVDATANKFDHGKEYWWRIYADDGQEQVGYGYAFTTQATDTPTVRQERPSDTATGIDADDTDGDISAKLEAEVIDAGPNTAIDGAFRWGDGTVIDSFSGQPGTYSTTVTGLNNGTTYDWYVTLEDDAGNSYDTRDEHWEGMYSFTTPNEPPDDETDYDEYAPVLFNQQLIIQGGDASNELRFDIGFVEESVDWSGAGDLINLTNKELRVAINGTSVDSSYTITDAEGNTTNPVPIDVDYQYQGLFAGRGSSVTTSSIQQQALIQNHATDAIDYTVYFPPLDGGGSGITTGTAAPSATTVPTAPVSGDYIETDKAPSTITVDTGYQHTETTQQLQQFYTLSARSTFTSTQAYGAAMQVSR